MSARDWPAACASYAEALVWAPGDARLLCGRGECLLRLDRAEEALEDAHAAAKRLPRSAQPHALAGAALQALGRHADAAAAYRRALALDAKLEVRGLPFDVSFVFTAHA